MTRFLPDAHYSIGAEFSTDHVRIILTNLDSSIKADRTLRHPDFKDIDRLMMTIQQEVKGILLEKEIPTHKVLGLGISVPGTVNEETKVLKIAPNLKIKDVDFTKYESLFQFPLLVENNANAAAIAELILGIAKTMHNLVYLSILPEGIRASIVVGGHPYKGNNRWAGEYGHITIASYGRQCSCGRQDCWELYASADALLTMYQEKTGKEAHTFKEFFVVLKKYDLAAVEVFDEYLGYLALGIQDIILVQDPHYVIIGGVLSPFEEILLEPLQEKIFAGNNFFDRNNVKIMCSTLKENDSILGASLLPFGKIFPLYDM